MEHRPLDERRWWDERAQTLPRPELRLLQEERLRVAVRRAFEGAPFWRSRLEAAGVGPDDVKTLDDLARMPLTRKDDLRRREAGTETRPPARPTCAFIKDH